MVSSPEFATKVLSRLASPEVCPHPSGFVFYASIQVPRSPPSANAGLVPLFFQVFFWGFRDTYLRTVASVIVSLSIGGLRARPAQPPD